MVLTSALIHNQPGYTKMNIFKADHESLWSYV